MKKTLTMAAIALGLASSAFAATTPAYTLGDVTYTTKTQTHTHNGGQHMSTTYNFTFTLTAAMLNNSSSDPAWTTASDGNKNYNGTADNKVALTSITLWEKGNQNNTSHPATLTISGSDITSFTSTGVSRYNDNEGGTPCLHDGSVWSFSGVNLLTVGETYTVTFSSSWGMPVTDNGTLDFASVGNSAYQPSNMTLVTQSVKAVPAAAIPEPATATLSLLALAGLAARRRRK